MTPDEIAEFTSLEKKFSFEDILLLIFRNLDLTIYRFRSIADAVLKRDKEYIAEKQKAKAAKCKLLI